MCVGGRGLTGKGESGGSVIKRGTVSAMGGECMRNEDGPKAQKENSLLPCLLSGLT